MVKNPRTLPADGPAPAPSSPVRAAPAAPGLTGAGEIDYLNGAHTKIYVGRSRHWAVAWLWFLS